MVENPEKYNVYRVFDKGFSDKRKIVENISSEY